MKDNKIIELCTEGKVSFKDGREFTRLIGGFGKNKPTITDKQVAELLGYKKGARSVRQRFNENIKHFNNKIHFLDLKSNVLEQDTKDILRSLGYTNQAINLAKNIYIFSQAGSLLFLKFAEGDKAVEIYKNFIEDYFKTKAENKVLKVTLQEQIDKMYEQYDLIYGKAIRTGDRELFAEASKINNSIIELEKQLTEEITVEKYKIYEDKYKAFMDEKGCFSFADASKILSTRAKEEDININVNKITLPKILRDKNVLSKEKVGNSYKNYPRSGYEKYFNTTSQNVEITVNRGKETIQKTQTKVNKLGLDFLYDVLTNNITL